MGYDRQTSPHPNHHPRHRVPLLDHVGGLGWGCEDQRGTTLHDKGRTVNEQFLATVLSLMTKQNVNPAGLARATGMSDTHVDGILMGKTGITLKTIVRFAKVFNVEPWELIK